MNNPAEPIAHKVAAQILTEYGRADNRLGEVFYPLCQGNAAVAREILLLMGTMHLQGAVSLMSKAGKTRQEIAAELYAQADKLAVG